MVLAPSPPLPAPPARRPNVRALVAGLVALVVIALSLIAVVGRLHTSASPKASPSSSGASSLPAELGGEPRVTSGATLQRIEGEAPALPVAGASYDLALYGDGNDPTSLLMVIHGLGDTVEALPRDIFFQTVGNGLASGMARSGLAGSTADFTGSVEASAHGADHDCIPLHRGGAAEGVICVFRASGTIGMVVLFDEADPHAAITISEQAAEAVR